MICNDQCMQLSVYCTLPTAHGGPHEWWTSSGVFVCSWPNVHAVPVPVTPSTPCTPPPDPDPASPSGPDPDDTTAPDPRPQPIDYSDWMSDEDLL